ncbi:MAG TPA: hypothetical protein VLZ89_16775 [Anaerolineales bacterium]|nr:hypothetical protein [Anaerolineales bacterium]
MKTPAGKECKYFFGDYFRGRSVEECSLLKASNQNWSAELCRTCPVPGILQANACEFLQLRGVVNRPLTAALQRRVQVSAYCDKVRQAVTEPHIGCGECHPLPPMFEIRSK